MFIHSADTVQHACLNIYKMLSKTWIIVFIVNFLSDYSYGQKDKNFFRRDYTYSEEFEGFYKIHTLHKSWLDAKRMCSLEGAILFYPESITEAIAMITFWNATQPYQPWVYVGISDFLVKDVFAALDGQEADVYYKWGANEPNGGVEDCVILKRDGTLYDIQCHNKGPFICKKSLLSLEWNQQCNMPDLHYSYNAEVDRCYKFHSTPMSWTDAYAGCSAEQSYLAVINTLVEADYLVRQTENYTKNNVAGNLTCDAIHLGFHNRLNDGWQAIRGATSLADTGYIKWGPNQPDGEDREKCGAMSYTGLLNDISCDTKCYFICEHEVVSPGSTSDGRSGQDVVY